MAESRLLRIDDGHYADSAITELVTNGDLETKYTAHSFAKNAACEEFKPQDIICDVTVSNGHGCERLPFINSSQLSAHFVERSSS